MGSTMEELHAVYHEKQVKELCALHALNNLFQDSKAFSKCQLDNICLRLSPDRFINPHRSILGFGNYDINVIMAALQNKNYETVWFDKRKDPLCLNLPVIMGFILNIPSEYKFGVIQLPIKRKHWIAIRKIGTYYYNLDSKLDKPEIIGNDGELIQFLRKHLECKDSELFVVVVEEVEKSFSWKKS
ncbi:Josephin-1 [Chamberlinius hualienensis]